ncbi:MAG: hypothetical protein ABI113_12785, partial [Mucilaginibacter sp.]
MKTIKFFLLILLSLPALKSIAQKRTVVMPDGNSSNIDIVLPDQQDKFVYTADADKCVMWDERTGKQLFTFRPASNRTLTAL